MSASLNRVSLIGNVGKDPEVRFLPSGDPVASFSLATSESWKDKSGEKQEKTEWHRIEVFGKLAEIVQQYVTKGSKLFVEGTLVYDEWEKDGVKKTMAKIKLGFGAKLVMLGGGGEKSAKPKREESKAAAGDDADLPF